MWVLFHEHLRNAGLQGKGEGIPLTSHYHFHSLHRHLDISRAITTDSSPLHIASGRTRTGKLWFLSASCHEITLIFRNFQKVHHANIYVACQKTHADGINGKSTPDMSLKTCL